MHRLDLNQLRILRVLLETASVKETAVRAGTSQAAVSRTLQSMRAVFKDPLLIKTKVGMVRTKRAEALAASIVEWVDATCALEAIAKHADGGKDGPS